MLKNFKLSVFALLAATLLGTANGLTNRNTNDLSEVENQNKVEDVVYKVQCTKGSFPLNVEFEYHPYTFDESLNDYVSTPLKFYAKGLEPGTVLDIYDDCQIPLVKDRYLATYVIQDDFSFEIDAQTANFEYLNLPKFNITILNPAYQLLSYQRPTLTFLEDVSMLYGTFTIRVKYSGYVKVYIINDKNEVVGLGEKDKGSFDVINKHVYSHAVIDYYSGMSNGRLTNYYAEEILDLNW